LKKLAHACKKIKDKYLENAETLSDNYYSTLSPDQLRKEFNKTLTERRELEAFMRNYNGGKPDPDLNKFYEKLSRKL
jgi:hypothetical protein